MAMGEHLRLWHMDFPPLIGILSRGIRGLVGDSIVALRLVPAAASAGLIVVAGLSARELAGGRFAQGLAALAVLASPLYLRTGALFQPVALDQLWWTLGLFFLLKLTSTGDPRWWIPFGAAAGFGLLTKFSILIFGAAVLLGLLVTRERRWLATPWPWAAAGLALLVGHPSLVGQLSLDFPLLGQMRDLSDAQLSRVSPPGFLLDQLLAVPATPIALLGVLALVGDRRRREHRLIGVVAIAAFGLVLLARGKSYYIAPIYPVLFGAGAVVLAEVEARPWGAVLRRGSVGLLAAYLVLTLPLGLPLLGPAAMEDYQVRLGLEERVTETNVGGQERLPQDYADMLGWTELVAEVDRIYDALPPSERDRAVILASNYGEAGAIDFYGPELDLPPARAFVGSYWFFGPGELPGEVLILVGFERDDFAEHCAAVEAAGRVDHPYAVAEQRDRTVYVCRRPTTTLHEFWPTVRGTN
ncbi:MAG: ArnT family glycosyltransferase [Gemmatimonadota bacterium]